MEPPRGSGQKILIVDDDQNHVQLLKKRLTASGYATITATDGVEGLDQARRQLPDLIITDVLLPRMNGFELVERLKENAETGNIPVIMMSAVYVTDEDMARGFELGAETYMAKADLALRKPLQEQMLLEATASLLKRETEAEGKAPARVLIVDDDPDAVRLISKLLQPQGFLVDSAGDGEEALAKALADPVDLMLVDVRLPGIDGLEVLARVRQEQPDLAVVVMTAFGSEQVAAEALRRGADDYLIKPLKEGEPLPTVGRVLDGQKRRRQLDGAARRLRRESAPELEGKERLIEELRQSSITLMEQYNRLLAAEEKNRAYAERLEQMVSARTEDLARRSRELAALHSVLSAATRSLDLPEVMLVTMGELAQLLGTSAAAAFVVDADTRRLRLVAQHNLAEEFLRRISREPGGEGAMAEVLRTGEGVCIEDPSDDPVLSALASPGSPLIFPMKSPTEVVGLVVAVCDPEGRIDESGWKLLDAVGEEIGVVVENVRLYDNLRQAYLSTIRSLAEAVDAKDRYTRGHSDKVAAYAVAVAREMGLKEEDLDEIRDAGMLHDIGKIGTPDSVLQKEGMLTLEETELMKMHPAASHRIVAQAQLSPEISRMIRHHHERFDGGGYPDGLSGEDIPIGSRILAVADAYDAMTSDRPYRNGLTRQAAIEELRRCAGGQFDPQVVQSFLAVRRDAEQTLGVDNMIKQS